MLLNKYINNKIWQVRTSISSTSLSYYRISVDDFTSNSYNLICDSELDLFAEHQNC